MAIQASVAIKTDTSFPFTVSFVPQNIHFSLPISEKPDKQKGHVSCAYFNGPNATFMKSMYLLISSIFITWAASSQVYLGQNTTGNNGLLTNFEALRQGNAVRLSWTAVNENNVSLHDIQRSANGSSFTSIGTINAQNNSTPYRYTFLDATPIQGNNYYRLRTVDKQGNISYSNILPVDQGFRRTDIRVLGNPVQSGILNLQLSNIDRGKYIISLYSNSGQKVFARSLDFSEGSSTETISIPQNISHGTYFLDVTDGAIRINKEIMLQ